MSSPTSRTLDLLRSEGWRCEVVERWVPNPRHPVGGVRKDAFGFADLLCFHPQDRRIRLVQACGIGGGSERRQKIAEAPEAAEWLSLHEDIGIEVIEWRKAKRRRVVDGKPTNQWTSQKYWTPTRYLAVLRNGEIQWEAQDD